MDRDLNSEFELTIESFDDDCVGIRCRGANSRFAGTVIAYASPDIISQLARAVSGFPSNAMDSRHFEFGTFDSKFAGGGVRLRLVCIDRVGHAQLRLDLRADPQQNGDETASFAIPIEAAAVDSFVRELSTMSLSVAASATLKGRGPWTS